MNLSKDVKVTLVQTPLAAGQTDPDSASVDMLGFEGVMFLGIIGPVTGLGTVSMKASQSPDDVNFNDLAGVVATGEAGGGDKFLVLDVYRPLERFVRTTLTRDVENSAYGGTLAIQYGAHNKPTVHDAATLAAEAILGVSPDAV